MSATIIEKFKYCKKCGEIGMFSKICHSSRKYKQGESKNNYQYYITKAKQKYNDEFQWRKVFYEEELYNNPIFEKSEFDNRSSNRYFYYCPICGKSYRNNNDFCNQCGNKIKSIKSLHTTEYYDDKALVLFGDSNEWKSILIEEEVSKNPLFDITKTEQNSPPAVVPVKPYSPEPNVPKCPTCGSTNIKRISSLSRATHGFAFGLLSKTARSQFECKNCRYKW